MTTTVRFGAAARAELDQAALWYEDKSSGLGDAFVDAVGACIDLISRWPGAGRSVPDPDGRREVRRAPVRRFPYHLAYVVHDDQIVVLALAHNRRRPNYWTDRLSD